MTISSTNRVAGPYIGDGVATIFPFTFKVFAAGDLEAATLNVSSGAIATLTLAVDYTVTLNADQDTNPGGSLTLIAGALAVGLSLTITTDMEELQGVELVNGGGFFPDVINDALDTLVILLQQLQLQAGRAIQIPFGDAGNMGLPSAVQRAGKMLMFDSSGNLQLVTLASGSSAVIGSQAAAGAVDGNNKIFTFQAAAGVTPTPLVYAGGIFQTPTTDYPVPVFVSGTTWRITFVDAPTIGPVTVLLFA